MKIEHFIWDFDGMLFNTYPHTVAAFCACCRRNGIPVDEKEAYDLFKVTMRHAFAHYGFTEALVKDFYEIENDLGFLPKGEPFPHIPALLRTVTERGGKNYLYTHRDAVALQYLDLYGLTPLFSGFVTGDDGFPLKPAPDALLALTERFGPDAGGPGHRYRRRDQCRRAHPAVRRRGPLPRSAGRGPEMHRRQIAEGSRNRAAGRGVLAVRCSLFAVRRSPFAENNIGSAGP